MKSAMLQLVIGLAAGGGLMAPCARGQASYTRPYTFITVAGTAGVNDNADGTNGAAKFYWPYGVAVDARGNLYVADNFESTIRKVVPAGTNWVATTIAGTAGVNGNADGTNGAAQFYQPTDLAVDGAGNLYVADSSNNTIRKITPAGTNWVVTTITATNQAVPFNYPTGVAVDTNGNVFVADTGNQTIRELTPAGTNWVLTTIAGTNGVSGSTDGTNQDARFNEPWGLAVDPADNLYVADAYNDTIRQITPEGTNWVVATIAGQPLASGTSDGSGLDAQFFLPSAVAVDTNGHVYVADTYNYTIRILVPDGANGWSVSTLAGEPTVPGASDGIVQQAHFNYPFGIASDPSGRLFVGDTYSGTLRLGLFTPVPNVAIGSVDPAGVMVFWPGAAFFTLQTNADLAAGNWADYGGAAAFNNGTNRVTFPSAASQLYFRLRD